MSGIEFDPGVAAANKAIEVGIASGLNYAVGFLAGCASAFADHGKADQAQAFAAAAQELGRVEPAYVRREKEAAINAEEGLRND